MKKTSRHLNCEKNILYTGFGDNGSTTLFDCKQTRISKSANLIEALGSVDELNAFLGVVKTSSRSSEVSIKIRIKILTLSEVILDIQQKLFVIQAELGGSQMFIKKSDLKKLENLIEELANALPPIKSFTISGGSFESATLDFARTLARRAERRVVSVCEEGVRKVSPNTIAYLNRLSSLLFALSRYTNHFLKIEEDHPQYNKK